MDSESLLHDKTLKEACEALSKSFLEGVGDPPITMEPEGSGGSERNTVEVRLEISGYDYFSIEVEVPDGLTKGEAKSGIQDILGGLTGNLVYPGDDDEIEVIEEEVERELKERRREYIDDCRLCGTTKVVNENTGDVFCPTCRRKNSIK